METKKKIGIWIDHSHAHLMELKHNAIISNIVKSDFTHDEMERTIKKSEHVMHNNEQHQQSSYYKQISIDLRNAMEILLFGPTTAKSELYNILKADHNFKNVKIIIIPADKMTENEQCDFVRNYFNSTSN